MGAIQVSSPGFWIALVVAIAAYGWICRWLLRWGTTDEERRVVMAGDELLPAALSIVTHGIDIEAPPSVVWPWLVQMGQGRGAFYSYTWLENLSGAGLRNADAIVAEWQDVEVGDPVRLHPKAEPLHVQELRGDRALVLQGHAGLVSGTTWAFELYPTPDGTRLLARMRILAGGPFQRFFQIAILEPGHSLMERGMLLGIRERVLRERTS